LNGGYIGGLNDEILLIGSKNLELMTCDYMHYESAKVPDRILTKEDLVTYGESSVGQSCVEFDEE